MQKRFAFLVHPRTDVRADLAGWFPPFGLVPERVCRWGLRTLPIPPLTTGKVTMRGRPEETLGIIVGVMLGAGDLLGLPRKRAARRVEDAVDHAARAGAEIVGLGALTAPLTLGGKTLARRKDVGVTNGNAFTAAMIETAARDLIGRCNSSHPTIAIVGAYGSVGTCVSKLLARRRVAEKLILVGRKLAHLEALSMLIRSESAAVAVETALDVNAVRAADLAIVLTSASGTVLGAEHLKPGAIVLDATQPRNTPRSLIAERPDVTVVDGGLVALPGVRIGVDIGLPPQCVYACFAETMLLALDGYVGHFTIGAPTVEQAFYVGALAKKYRHHGFTLAPYHSFGRLMSEDARADPAPLDGRPAKNLAEAAA